MPAFLRIMFRGKGRRNVVARETRKAITNALLDLALENPSRTAFSMTEIAERAGISRQAIYQKPNQILPPPKKITDEE